MRPFSLLLSALLLSQAAHAAQVTLPQGFRLLATQPAVAFDRHQVTLPAGTHQLLIRFEEVIPARSSSDNDTVIHSEPQLLRLDLDDDTHLSLKAEVPAAESALAAYAKAPRFQLVDEKGTAHAFIQDEIKLTGFVFNPDFARLLSDYNRDGGKASLSPATAVQTVAGDQAEASIRQWFLQASPEQRKRFMAWAVQQL